MAQPGPAPEAAVHPINIHWTQQKGWWITPATNSVPLSDTVQFTTDTNCTLCFSPNNTVFGASLNVNVGTPVDVPVGTANFTVNLCATTQGGTCTPAPRITADDMGTITVGSGTQGPK